MQRNHKFHPVHIRLGEPPLLCTHCKIELSKWTCAACLEARPPTDPDHILEDGGRFAGGGPEVVRRTKKDFGEKLKRGGCWAPRNSSCRGQHALGPLQTTI